MTSKPLSLLFGACTPPIRVQLDQQGIGCSAENGDIFQRDADAIARLNVRQLLTDREAQRARVRLGKRIKATLLGGPAKVTRKRRIFTGPNAVYRPCTCAPCRAARVPYHCIRNSDGRIFVARP